MQFITTGEQTREYYDIYDPFLAVSLTSSAGIR